MLNARIEPLHKNAAKLRTRVKMQLVGTGEFHEMPPSQRFYQFAATRANFAVFW